MVKSVPSYEKPCYEAFQQIHKQILEVKNNRNNYINSKQVYQIYHEFLSQLHELSVTRKDEELKGIQLQVPNSNDVKIDDIWQLLSLCFVTCGLIKFAPATYSSLSTVHKLLDHLQECQVYTLDDLKPIHVRLDEIREIITQSEEAEEEENSDHDSTSKAEVANYYLEERMLLRNKLNKCYQLYNQLEANFKNIPPDLEVTYNDLIILRKLLLNYFTLEESASGTSNSRPKVATMQSLNELKNKLKEINAKRDPEDGRFTSQVATPVELESIQVVLNGLFDDCQNLIQDLYIRDNNDDVTDLFQAMSLKDSSIQDDKYKSFFDDSYKLYQQLIDLKSKLENLLVTRRWTMRETDLYSFQQSLKTIDQKRLQLINELPSQSSSGDSADGTTTVSPPLIKRIELLLLYLLRRCYSLIYKLLESSEPVSESLQPIHNQLSTVKRCLLDIRRINGLNNLRELYPFQMKLALIDVKRIDGKFEVNGQIPEGQGTLNALLAECYDIVHELKIELEEKEDMEGDDDDDDDDEQSLRIGRLGTPVPAAGPSGLRGPGNFDSNNSSTVNLFRKGELGALLDFDDIETKRKRFAGFKEADYDSDSFNEDDDDEDSFSSDAGYESNDYY